MFPYALTIFLGAFLLFQVQPLIGKYILPWFGGGPGVWTTCMLFFQLLLLAGYAYAHVLTRRLQPRKQAIVHLVLLAAALALLPITPADAWKPRGDQNPILHIFLLLTVALGLPYFVLSATGPLLQQWFSTSHNGASPYRLYALSNTGSLLALLSYPFFFETHFTRRTQAAVWGWSFAVYALGCALCALKLWKASSPSRLPTPLNSAKQAGAVVECRQSPNKVGVSNYGTPNPRFSTFNALLWLLWPACASVLLLATTNKICQDVAVVPFLWVLPLALYLLSFIITFDNSRWYGPFPFALALIAAIVVICWGLAKGTSIPIRTQLTLYSAGLFICCLVCHGELRPFTSLAFIS